MQDMAFFDKTNTQDLIQRVADDAQITASATTANLAKAYRYLNSALGGSVLLWHRLGVGAPPVAQVGAAGDKRTRTGMEVEV